MKKELLSALQGESEDREFNGVSIRVGHLSAEQRLEYVDRFTEDVDTKKVVELYATIIVDCVEGIEAADVDALRKSSWPRFEELAKLAMQVNGLGDDSVEEIAKN